MAILWGAESASRNPQPSGPKKPRPAAQPGGAARPRIRALSLSQAKGRGPNPRPDCGPRFGRGPGLSGAGRLGVPGGRFCTPENGHLSRLGLNCCLKATIEASCGKRVLRTTVRSTLLRVACRLSSVVCRLSAVVCGLWSVVCRLGSGVCRLSSVLCCLSSAVCRLSPVACRLSSVVCRLSSVVVCRLSSVVCRLSSVVCLSLPPRPARDPPMTHPNKWIDP